MIVIIYKIKFLVYIFVSKYFPLLFPTSELIIIICIILHLDMKCVTYVQRDGGNAIGKYLAASSSTSTSIVYYSVAAVLAHATLNVLIQYTAG